MWKDLEGALSPCVKHCERASDQQRHSLETGVFKSLYFTTPKSLICAALSATCCCSVASDMIFFFSLLHILIKMLPPFAIKTLTMIANSYR